MKYSINILSSELESLKIERQRIIDSDLIGSVGKINVLLMYPILKIDKLIKEVENDIETLKIDSLC